jgi:type IX secretion system PorP/SprF family membrane protein
MKQTFIIAIFFIIVMAPKKGVSQQLPQFSQYMYNTISINPAYAGSREIMVINVLNRNQWIGVNGAPVTQTVSVNTSIPGTNLGIGLSLINDQLGYDKTFYGFADVSYTLNFNDLYWLSFGLKAGASKFSFDDGILNDPEYNNDPYLSQVNFKWNPNFGIGVYFRGDSFYLGLSSPKMISTNSNNNQAYVPTERPSYYLNGGYLFDFYSSNLKFKPTFLIKYTNGAPITLDLTGNILFNEKLWLGVAYRTGDSFGAMANFKVSRGLSIGYAYDYITSDLGNFSPGSNEIIINYEFEFPRRRCTCKDLYN